MIGNRQISYFSQFLVSVAGLGGVGGHSLSAPLCSRLVKPDVTQPRPLIGQHAQYWPLIGQHRPALPPPQPRSDVSSVIPGPPWRDHHLVTHIESVTQRDTSPVTPGHPGTSLLHTVNDFPNTGSHHRCSVRGNNLVRAILQIVSIGSLVKFSQLANK